MNHIPHFRTIKLEGRVIVTSVSANGDRKVLSDKTNLIVSNGLTSISRLLAQVADPDPTNYAIFEILFGDGNQSTALDQVNVQGNPIISVATAVVEDVAGTPGLTEYSATLGNPDGNGNTIRELALVNASGGMYARQIIEPVVKTVAIGLEVLWRFQFVAS